MTLTEIANLNDDPAVGVQLKNLDIGRIINIDPITIEASSRKYYRLHMSGLPQTIILCSNLPVPYTDDDKFIELSRFFKRRGFPCSEILIDDSANGRLFLRDAGDIDLSTALKTLEPQSDSARRMQLVNQALDLLTPLQNFDPPSAISGRYFDSGKLIWEMEYFYQNLDLICAYLKKDSPVTFEMKRFLSRLCNKLDKKEDLVICHRDYHGRNLILSSDSESSELTVIDFQDARMGLPVYDAASLIYDPYTPLTIKERFTAKSYFESRLKPVHKKYMTYFYAQALQRLIKALGTYCHQIFVKNHSGYIDCIPGTLSNLEQVIQLGHFPDSFYLFLNQFRQEISPLIPDIAGKFRDKAN